MIKYIALRLLCSLLLFVINKILYLPLPLQKFTGSALYVARGPLKPISCLAIFEKKRQKTHLKENRINLLVNGLKPSFLELLELYFLLNIKIFV